MSRLPHPKDWLVPGTWLNLSHMTNFGFLLAQFLLILLPSDRDPVADFVSEYVYSTLYWVFIAGLLFQLATALFQAHVLYYFVKPSLGGFMAVWAFAIIGITIFRTDPGGYPVTVGGYLHAFCVIVGLGSFMFVCWKLAKLSDEIFLKQLVLLSIMSFLLFVLTLPLNIIGITERFILLLVFVLHFLLVGTIEHIMTNNEE